MALASFTVGRDCSLVVIAPNGTRLDISGMVDFSWTPEYQNAKSAPLNTPPMERFLPAGHRLKVSIDRNTPTNDALFSQIEAGWWAVGSIDPGTSNNGSFFIYINEISGAQSVLQFGGVSMKLTSGGDFKTDSPVKQTIECFAQTYVKAA